MHHRVESFHVGQSEIAEIPAILWNRLKFTAEIGSRIKINIEPGDFVAGRMQEWSRHGADVAAMTGEQNSQYDSR